MSIKSAYENFKDPNQVKPWEVLNPKKGHVEGDVYRHRMSICDACPELFKLTNQCKECLCIMPLKASLSDAECPLGKWGKDV